MRHGKFIREKFDSLADYRRKEAEKARTQAFRERLTDIIKERQPTSKFNGDSFSLAYFSYYRKDARKAAFQLDNKGYATKISKHINNPNKKGKPYFIVWKR